LLVSRLYLVLCNLLRHVDEQYGSAIVIFDSDGIPNHSNLRTQKIE